MLPRGYHLKVGSFRLPYPRWWDGLRVHLASSGGNPDTSDVRVYAVGRAGLWYSRRLAQDVLVALQTRYPVTWRSRCLAPAGQRGSGREKGDVI